MGWAGLGWDRLGWDGMGWENYQISRLELFMKRPSEIFNIEL